MLITNNKRTTSYTIVYTTSAFRAYNIKGCLIVPLGYHGPYLFSIAGHHGIALHDITLISDKSYYAPPYITTCAGELVQYKYNVWYRNNCFTIKHNFEDGYVVVKHDHRSIAIDDVIDATRTDYLDIGILMSPISLVINDIYACDLDIYNTLCRLF